MLRSPPARGATPHPCVVVDGMSDELGMELLDRLLASHHVSKGRVLGLIVSAVCRTGLTLLCRLLTCLAMTSCSGR